MSGIPATALVISGTTYDLAAEPSATSSVVIDARTEVLQNLDLEQMLVNLERTNDLLYVASCGVSGNRKDATLSGKVQKLQYGLLTSCSNAILAMGKFADAAGTVLTSLRGAFRFLYTSPPREDRTIQVLSRCEAQATTMAETAGSLAANFKALADDAEGVLEGTLTARDMEEQERLAAIDRKRELNAKNERAKALRDELTKQMKKVQTLVEEAREAQNKAEDRAFGLAIAGNITSALGSAVQGFMSVRTAPMMMASQVVGALNPSAGAASQVSAGMTGAPPMAAPMGAPPMAAPPMAAPMGAPPMGAPPMAAPMGAPPMAAPMGAPSTLSSTNELAAAAGIAAGSAKSAEGNVAMASSYGDIAARYAEEKRKWLDLLMKMQDEQRQALGDIAQYAEQMKTADLNTAAAKSAVDSLQQAVGALKQIVTILETAKVFWEMMAQTCKRLASPAIRQDIEMFKDDPPEDRLQEYIRDDFKLPLLQLAWRWCALKAIADDYGVAVARVREKVVETANKAPSIEEAKRLAPALAQKLQLDINKDMQAIEAATAQLRAEQAQLQPQRAAA
jgi:hypothetical protein